MKKLLLFLLLIPNFAFSGWEYVNASSEDGSYSMIYYADFSTLKKMTSNKVRILYYVDNYIFENSNLNHYGHDMEFSIKIYAEFDCKNELQSELAKTHHMEFGLKGKPFIDKNLVTNQIVIPKSNASYIFNLVCSKIKE